MDNKLLCTEGKAILQDNFIGFYFIQSENGEDIASVIKHTPLRPSDKANAERIVTAWNFHDDLVEALGIILQWGKTKDGKFTYTTSKEAADELKAIYLKANSK